jgi:exopolyphosphatase/guanosine-5'-triphosphate,3'-diphosphate pyrophosphatase
MPHSTSSKKKLSSTSIDYSESNDVRMGPVLRLAEMCNYPAEHTRQVTRLALRLFDELQPLHHLSAEERFWLEAGGILHDIGWVEGWRSHHKASPRITITTPILPFNSKERLLIGSIARYHCKALPSVEHDHYAALLPAERTVVSTLAAMLRLADGLDSTHQGLVKNLTCEMMPDAIIIRCKAHRQAKEDQLGAVEKADLFEKVFNRKTHIKWIVKK